MIRGSTNYFVGRREEQDDFKAFCDHVHQKKATGSFLIQGATGSGKSVLIKQFEKKIIDPKRWQISHLSPYGIVDLLCWREAFGLKKHRRFYQKEYIVLRHSKTGQGEGIPAWADWIQKSLKEVTKPILLITDEAQMLASKAEYDDWKSIVQTILQSWHLLKSPHGLVWLIVGLGNTEWVFKAYGFQTQALHHRVNLGSFSEAEERDYWDHETVGTRSITDAEWQTIRKETQGWPLHVDNYTETWLTNQKRIHAPIDDYFQEARKNQEVFFRTRLNSFEGTALKFLLLYLQHYPQSKFDHFVRQVKTYDIQSKPEEFLVEVIRKGILGETKQQDLWEGIPGLHDYFIHHSYEGKRLKSLLSSKNY
ncbi:MAG: ATP-binding protein [Flavobacteriaceae bacterium]|nr:ATP-binding protein [Flavobacteriaceae bacterium]MCY4215836.1 ATP-binding protein [Flavobacteriaceae bacterium]MCY4253967.1 ATP-binding protein [Flavobacteriaceae bacterium]